MTWPQEISSELWIDRLIHIFKKIIIKNEVIHFGNRKEIYYLFFFTTINIFFKAEQYFARTWLVSLSQTVYTFVMYSYVWVIFQCFNSISNLSYVYIYIYIIAYIEECKIYENCEKDIKWYKVAKELTRLQFQLSVCNIIY